MKGMRRQRAKGFQRAPPCQMLSDVMDIIEPKKKQASETMPPLRMKMTAGIRHHGERARAPRTSLSAYVVSVVLGVGPFSERGVGNRQVICNPNPKNARTTLLVFGSTPFVTSAVILDPLKRTGRLRRRFQIVYSWLPNANQH